MPSSERVPGAESGQGADRVVRSAATLSDPDIQAILDPVPCLAGLRSVRRLDGGLTNVIVQVTLADRVVVARISTDDSGMLAIDRDAEHLASLAAASAGVAPEVVCRDAAAGVLVVAWIEGHTLSAPDLQDDSTLAGAAQLCHRLHRGPRFATDFDMFAVQARYLDVIRRHGYRIPDGYVDLLPELDRVRTALERHPARTVPCHNDLLAENLIDDGKRLWMLDFEYSGNNDPAFELGNLASESLLSVDQLGELVRIYHAAPDVRAVAVQVARARLQATVAKYGWTLWGSIQHSVSTVDFDFWSWSLEKYHRAIEEFRSADFEPLLGQVAG